MKDKIPFNYKDIEIVSHGKRFETIWESVAFRMGAMWAVTHIYTEKSIIEINDEMGVPT